MFHNTHLNFSKTHASIKVSVVVSSRKVVSGICISHSQTLQYMAQITILEIVGKDRGELYGTSQEVASVVSPSEE